MLARAALVQKDVEQLESQARHLGSPLTRTATAAFAGMATGLLTGRSKDDDRDKKRDKEMPTARMSAPERSESEDGFQTLEAARDALTSIGLSIASRYLFSAYVQPLIDEPGSSTAMSGGHEPG